MARLSNEVWLEMELSLQLAFVLLLAGLLILFLELFIPSAGMLFVLAAICIVASIAIAFWQNFYYGTAFMTLVFVLSVTLPGLGFELWKRSPIGRAMFLPAPPTRDANDADRPSGEVPEYAILKGQIGKTITRHMPGGVSEIQGRRIDTVAEGVMIEKGSMIRVVDVQGNHVIVRKMEQKALNLDLLESEG